MDTIKIYLGIPLFELYQIKSLDKIVFSTNIAEKLIKNRDLDTRKAIHEALNWAKNNPAFEFESIMKNAPVVGKLPFSNSEIYDYLVRFKTFMEEDNGLLSVESNPKY